MRVTVSDVLSKWVGESEQNIAKLFRKASDENAILLFDEADSLLSNRSQMQAHHEVQLVNELLAQMESNSQPLFAATNYADKLDKAVLRRFDVKLECGYLRTEQALTLFKQALKTKRITKQSIAALSQLHNLTPGDFAILARRQRFNPAQMNQQSAVALLVQESQRKRSAQSIGFISKPR